MQPHGPKSSRRAAERAAHAHIQQHLGWLLGFPQSAGDGYVLWRAVPSGEPAFDVHVHSERLRASTFGLHSVLRRFPRALGGVVGDVDAWEASVRARLARLAASVHDGAPLPTSRELGPALRQNLPEDVAAALAWVLEDLAWRRADAATVAERRLGAWSSALALVRTHLGPAQARELAVRLVVRSESTRALGQVEALLADPRAWSTPLNAGDFRERLKRLIETARGNASTIHEIVAEPLTRPPATLAVELANALLEPAADARLRAFAALGSPRELGAWSDWWARATDVERDVRSAIGRAALHLKCRAVLVDLCGDLLADFNELLPAPPPPVSTGERWRSAAALLAAAGEDATAFALAAIEEVPDAPGDKRPVLRTAKVWTEALADGLAPRRAAELLRLRRALAAGAAEQDRALLTIAFDELVVYAYAPPRTLEWEARAAATETLTALLRRGDDGRRELARAGGWPMSYKFAAFVNATRDPERAADWIVAARDVTGWLDYASVAHLARAGEDDGAFWRGAADLAPSADDFDALRTAAAVETTAALLHGLVRDGQVQLLGRLALATRALQSLDSACSLAEPPPPPADEAGLPPWLSDELRSDAAELRTLAGDRALARAIGTAHTDPERIACEVRALEALDSPSAHQAQRLANLRARLANPAPPMDATQRARRALGRRLRTARAERWLDALVARASKRLPAAVAAELTSGDARRARSILELAMLRPSVRELAWKLLAKADLSGEPAHVEWRGRMKDAGVDLSAWRVTGPLRTATSPEGRTLVFAFEDDPREVFEMGLWFGTCLTPGDMNFFSAVANAADENKRVLVARDAKGVVQVRCLFGVTREGALLAFHVYAHEEGVWATAEVRAIAEDLAAHMGAYLVPSGKVETLVAPDWYDDGPRDLTGALRDLDDGGPLFDALENAPHERACAVLEAALGRPFLTAALEDVVTRAAIEREPARLASLEPLLVERRLADWAACRVARALEHSAPGLALDVLARNVSVQRRRRAALNHCQAESAELLTKLGAPSLALRVLGRAPTWDTDAVHARATALLALGRIKRARAALEPLARAGDERAARRLARAPLA